MGICQSSNEVNVQASTTKPPGSTLSPTQRQEQDGDASQSKARSEDRLREEYKGLQEQHKARAVESRNQIARLERDIEAEAAAKEQEREQKIQERAAKELLQRQVDELKSANEQQAT